MSKDKEKEEEGKAKNRQVKYTNPTQLNSVLHQ